MQKHLSMQEVEISRSLKRQIFLCHQEQGLC